MNRLLPPQGMVHSLTSTTCPTTISSSMHVLGMMPPTHQPLPREEMYMQLLAPRISPLLRNPTNPTSLKTLTHHLMTFTKYIKPNITKSLPNLYQGSRGIMPQRTIPQHPRNPLKNMMVLFMFLQKYTNSSALKLLLPSRNTILRPSTN